MTHIPHGRDPRNEQVRAQVAPAEHRGALLIAEQPYRRLHREAMPSVEPAQCGRQAPFGPRTHRPLRTSGSHRTYPPGFSTIVPRTKEYSTCNVRILEIPLALVHVKSIISLV